MEIPKYASTLLKEVGMNMCRPMDVVNGHNPGPLHKTMRLSKNSIS